MRAGYVYPNSRRQLLGDVAAGRAPDSGLRGDVEDILDVIAKATGEPWDEGWIERAAPRPR